MKHGCFFLLILSLGGCSTMQPAHKQMAITAADQLAQCLGSMVVYQLANYEQQDAATEQ